MFALATSAAHNVREVRFCGRHHVGATGRGGTHRLALGGVAVPATAQHHDRSCRRQCRQRGRDRLGRVGEVHHHVRRGASYPVPRFGGEQAASRAFEQSGYMRSLRTLAVALRPAHLEQAAAAIEVEESLA